MDIGVGDRFGAAIINGTVRNEAGELIPASTVFVDVPIHRGAQADSGIYSFVIPPANLHKKTKVRLIARRIGYEPVSTVFELKTGDSVTANALLCVVRRVLSEV
jgi:hypothetical protein